MWARRGGKSIDTGGGHRRECRVDLLRTAGVGPNQFEPEGARGVVQHFGIVTPSRVERVAEHANSGDVRRRLLQNLQALLLLVSTIERQARDVAGRADHVADEL